MRNPFKAAPVTQAEIKKFRRTGTGTARVAQASATQARQPRAKSLAAQSAAWKKAQKKAQRQQGGQR